MSDRPPSQEKAYRILDRLLRRELIKAVAFEEEVHLSTVYNVKKMFPLFFAKED